MKRFLLILIFIISTIISQAQEHTKFKGISLDNTLDFFIEQLKQKGYTLDDIGEKGVTLKGDFAGVKDCTIVAYYTCKSKKIWKVVVCLPTQEWWPSLKKEYFHYKDLYSEKYGEPESYEFFSPPYSDGDGNEMKALWFDKCHYMSIYKTKTGCIALNLMWRGYLSISYEDSLNLELKQIEDEEKLREDREDI